MSKLAPGPLNEILRKVSFAIRPEHGCDGAPQRGARTLRDRKLLEAEFIEASNRETKTKGAPPPSSCRNSFYSSGNSWVLAAYCRSLQNDRNVRQVAGATREMKLPAALRGVRQISRNFVRKIEMPGGLLPVTSEAAELAGEEPVGASFARPAGGGARAGVFGRACRLDWVKSFVCISPSTGAGAAAWVAGGGRG